MKIDWNKKYFTIGIYSIIVFFICSLIYKFTISWADTKTFVLGVISTLSPFLIAFLIAYFMNPMVIMFEDRLLPSLRIGKKSLKSPKALRILSILLSYIVFLTSIIILLSIIIPQVANSLVEFAETFSLENLSTTLSNLSFSFNDTTYTIDTSLITTYINDNLPKTFNQITTMVPNLFNTAKSFASGIIDIVIAFIVSIYLIYSKESASEKSRKVVIAIFSKNTAKSIFNTASHAHKVFSSFFIGKLIDSIIVGFICFIILTLAKMPFAMLISILVGITNIIPYFGPFIGGGIGFFLLLLINPVKALWFVVIIIALQQFDGNILGPKILGDSIGLSPFWVIFSIIVFGSMFGFMGMFLGAPFFSVIKSIVDKQVESRYQKKIKIATKKSG